MWNFSERHKLQVRLPGWYGRARLIILHVSLYSVPLSLSVHMRLDNSVCLLFVLCLKEALCSVYLVLKVFSVMPM